MDRCDANEEKLLNEEGRQKCNKQVLKPARMVSWARIGIFVAIFALAILFALPFNSPAGHNAGAADNVTLFPRVDLLPSEGPVNSKVFVRIYDYQSSKSVIIFFGSVSAVTAGTCVVANTITDDSGYAVANFNVDLLPGGRYVVLADDGVNAKNAYFKITPKVKLEQTSGYVGDDVVLSGNGFSASKPVSVYLDGTRMSTGDSDSNGQIANFKFTMPSTVMGSHDLKLQDTDGNTTTLSYTIRQKMSVTPAIVQVGNEINISGTGFLQKDITIYLDDRDVTVVRGGPDGSFSTKLVIPAMGDGIHKLKADDGTNRSYFDLTVAPSIIVSPDNGSVNSQSAVQGFGFRPGLPVAALYDSTKLDAPVVNATGGFTFTFKIPKSKAGPHVISISDGINTLKANFAVESTPPVAPTLITPQDSAKVTKDVRFEWNPVSDPSGVVYSLQLADDAKFSQILLEESNLLVTSYDLTEDKNILTSKKTPYYWRVKAVDGASNTSAWSAIGTFYKAITVNSLITNMPDWTKYVLLGLGLLLVGFMLFLFSRALKRIRHKSDDEYEEEAPELNADEEGEWGYESEGKE